jgi:hypothetical protein
MDSGGQAAGAAGAAIAQVYLGASDKGGLRKEVKK